MVAVTGWEPMAKSVTTCESHQPGFMKGTLITIRFQFLVLKPPMGKRALPVIWLKNSAWPGMVAHSSKGRTREA